MIMMATCSDLMGDCGTEIVDLRGMLSCCVTKVCSCCELEGKEETCLTGTLYHGNEFVKMGILEAKLCFILISMRLCIPINRFLKLV